MFTLSRKKKKRKVGKKKNEIHKNKIAISFLACVIFIPLCMFPCNIYGHDQYWVLWAALLDLDLTAILPMVSVVFKCVTFHGCITKSCFDPCEPALGRSSIL